MFHEDRLWAILNRAWRPLSEEEFNDLSYEEINLAIDAASLTREDVDKIWVKEIKAFEVH